MIPSHSATWKKAKIITHKNTKQQETKHEQSKPKGKRCSSNTPRGGLLGPPTRKSTSLSLNQAWRCREKQGEAKEGWSEDMEARAGWSKTKEAVKIGEMQDFIKKGKPSRAITLGVQGPQPLQRQTTDARADDTTGKSELNQAWVGCNGTLLVVPLRWHQKP